MTESTPHEELKKVLGEIEEHLRAQEELFGETVYVERPKKKKKAAAAEPPSMPGFASPGEPWAGAGSLKQLEGQICDCLKCPLGPTRTKFVFGDGNPQAKIMFIGEGPGADEDAQGIPFVGRAGQLLNKILAAIDLKREDVYICNIVKCRPPNNREPLPVEMETCTPYLYKQIDLIKPKFIVCLGRTSAQWLLQTKDSLGKLRESVYDYKGAKLIVTYHPAALLRNEGWKRPTWEDMKKLKKLYDEEQAG